MLAPVAALPMAGCASHSGHFPAALGAATVHRSLKDDPVEPVQTFKLQARPKPTKFRPALAAKIAPRPIAREAAPAKPNNRGGAPQVPVTATPASPAPVPPPEAPVAPSRPPAVTPRPTAPSPPVVETRPTDALPAPLPGQPPLAQPLPVSPRAFAEAIETAERLLRSGNVKAAREALDPAVKAGSVDAIVALAATYDPLELATQLVPAGSEDVQMAVKLYAEAAARGSRLARVRLDRLLAQTSDEPAQPKRR